MGKKSKKKILQKENLKKMNNKKDSSENQQKNLTKGSSDPAILSEKTFEPKSIKSLEKIDPQITKSPDNTEHATQNDVSVSPINKINIKAFFIKAAVGLLIIVVIFGLFAGLALYSDNKIPPRTKIGNLDIGYIPFTQAKEKLVQETANYLKTPIVFNYQEKIIQLSSEDLGIKLNMDQTLQSLPVFYFKNPDPLKFFGSLANPHQLSFQYSLDRDKIVQLLESKFELVRAKNATLILKDKKIEVQSEVSGKIINAETLFVALNSHIENLGNSPITILVEPESPVVTTEQLNKQKDNLIPLLQKNITVFSENKKVVLQPLQHLDALQFIPLANSPATADSKLTIEFIPSHIDSFFVQNLFKDLEVPTSPVNISTDTSGKVLIEGKGEDGKLVPRKKFYELLNQAINNQQEKVEVPIDTEKATVTISEDMQELGIKEQLATGYTTYFGSPANRMHNIDVGITKYNGLLIKPGEEFSFNQNLGPVNGKSGYKLEKVIKGNKAEYEYGGGICQVSTTLYRAVLFAGLPVVDRRSHTWKVSYYGQVLGHGLDATIYLGGQDLKFLNDTPGNLLIQSYTDGAKAYFKFYGTNDGRTVKMEGPIGGGMNYKWIRHLFDKEGKETKTETINSKYIPMPIAQPPSASPTTAAGPSIKPPIGP